MSDRYIEKSFLYGLCISLLLHIGGFAALYFFPSSAPIPPKEPVFIDLQQMPEQKQAPVQRPQQITRQSEQRVRVPTESAPRGNAARDTDAAKKTPSQPSARQPSPAVKQSETAQSAAKNPATEPGFSASSLLKPKERPVQPTPSVAQLFPGASRMAKLEESYRRKFENDIAEGDTRFLNSDDIVFGSFLRRFEGAVYGVWRYPQEAALKGIEGITPVRITFNRRGEITKIQQLESSGARILDEEVLRTLRAIGPVGGFPKGYDKEEFHLIAFFQYGGARRSLR